MHAQGSAESNLQKLTRACGQLLPVNPDHSAPLIDGMGDRVCGFLEPCIVLTHSGL